MPGLTTQVESFRRCPGSTHHWQPPGKQGDETLILTNKLESGYEELEGERIGRNEAIYGEFRSITSTSG